MSMKQLWRQKKQQKQQKKAADSVDEAEQTWTDYNTTIKIMKDCLRRLFQAITKKIEEAMEKLTTSFITAENGNRESLNAGDKLSGTSRSVKNCD